MLLFNICAVLVLVYIHSLYNERFEFEIAPSTIHGVGVFTRIPIKKGSVLFPVVSETEKKVTPLGSKVNHSYTPNCVLRKYGDTWCIVANEDIPVNAELTGDYNDTPPFLQKPLPHYA
jgi:SET domain-containing protein